MTALRWIITALMFLNAGWMTFDGMRALLIGDYVTPASGPHAGRLGPWAGALKRIGLEPRSTPVKLGFVVYGGLTMLWAAGFAARVPGSGRALLIAAVAGLWYVPIGTVVNLVSLALLLIVGPR